VPRHFARLVVDYFAYTTRPGAPRHVARLVTWLVVDYFDYATRPGAPQHVVRLVTRLVVHYFDYAARPGAPRHVARLVTRLVFDYFDYVVRPGAHRHVARLVTRLILDYFNYAARPGASARRAAHHPARRAARCRLLRLRRAFGCLGSSRGSSRRSLSTTSLTPRVRVPQHVARPVTWLVVDYSVCRDFVLQPHWLYFSHAVRRD
jgi:hypothetical protein